MYSQKTRNFQKPRISKTRDSQKTGIFKNLKNPEFQKTRDF